jgi:hypothetical protein
VCQVSSSSDKSVPTFQQVLHFQQDNGGLESHLWSLQQVQFTVLGELDREMCPRDGQEGQEAVQRRHCLFHDIYSFGQ